jgi:CNT family concentrative nucleoside transporter
MAWVIMKVMRVSGAETLSVCANAFIGQTEAPLVVKPYVKGMTKSELLCLMVGGMATIAGGVMAAYVQMLGGSDPESQRQFAKHLLTASIMAAPAALLIAKVMVPETEQPQTAGNVTVPVEKTATNVIDAAAAGASDGLKLALNVGAMLLAFTALIALINGMVGGLADAVGLTAWMNPGVDARCLADAAFAADPANACQVSRLSLSMVLGWVMAPLAWVIGVPWSEATTVGGLIGTKIVLNEFIAYGALSDIIAGNVAGATLSPTSVLIATYALCGFANFSSIAIQLGGIGSIAPERRADLARFGLKAVLGGSLATMMTATIAGVISQL